MGGAPHMFSKEEGGILQCFETELEEKEKLSVAGNRTRGSQFELPVLYH